MLIRALGTSVCIQKGVGQGERNSTKDKLPLPLARQIPVRRQNRSSVEWVSLRPFVPVTPPQGGQARSRAFLLKGLQGAGYATFVNDVTLRIYSHIPATFLVEINANRDHERCLLLERFTNELWPAFYWPHRCRARRSLIISGYI